MSSSNIYENGQPIGSNNGGSYSLRWNSFQTHLTKGMGKLLEEDEFTDVTLACDGQYLKAHKVLLSLCSPYFKRLFQANNSDKNGTTIVILSNVRFKDLENIIRFIYHGQTNVSQADLSRFLKTGELLQIEGLAQTQLPKPDIVDDDVIALSTPLPTRALSTLSNDATRPSINKNPVDRGCNSRASSRHRSYSEVPVVEGLPIQPPNKRIKIVSTSSVSSKLQSILANTNNTSTIPVSQSACVTSDHIPDVPLNSDSGYGQVMPVESANENDNMLHGDRDPLESDDLADPLNTQQPHTHDLNDEQAVYSVSDHERNNDGHLLESDIGRYGNSVIMETNNGLYGPNDDETVGEVQNRGPVPSSHHQSMHGNREPGPSASATGEVEMSRVSGSSTQPVTTFEDEEQNLPYYLPSFSSITTDEVTSCTMCNALVPWANFSEHMSSVHSVLNAQNHWTGRVECPICFRLLKNKNSLKVHKSIYHRVAKSTATGDISGRPADPHTHASGDDGQGELSVKLESSNSSD